MVKWKIDYYSTPSGREPVQEFVDSLDKYHNFVILIKVYGLGNSQKITLKRA